MKIHLGKQEKKIFGKKIEQISQFLQWKRDFWLKSYRDFPIVMFTVVNHFKNEGIFIQHFERSCELFENLIKLFKYFHLEFLKNDNEKINFELMHHFIKIYITLTEFSEEFNKVFIENDCLEIIMNHIFHNSSFSFEFLNEKLIGEISSNYLCSKLQFLNNYFIIILNVIKKNVYFCKQSMKLELEKYLYSFMKEMKENSNNYGEISKFTVFLCFSGQINMNKFKESEQLLLDNSILDVYSNNLKFNEFYEKNIFKFTMNNNQIFTDLNILSKNHSNLNYLFNILPLIFNYLAKHSIYESDKMNALECVYSLSFYDECRDIIKEKMNQLPYSNLLAKNILWETSSEKEQIKLKNEKKGKMKESILLVCHQKQIEKVKIIRKNFKKMETNSKFKILNNKGKFA